jgi:hypothetical protein
MTIKFLSVAENDNQSVAQLRAKRFGNVVFGMYLSITKTNMAPSFYKQKAQQ